jgi:hypothetical protein
MDLVGLFKSDENQVEEVTIHLLSLSSIYCLSMS